MTLSEIILSAKLGRSRKDAQVDCCGEFAGALFDALQSRGIVCSMVTASSHFLGQADWYHAVVGVGGRYFDSLGEFSEEIYRARARIRPKVTIDIRFRLDARSCAFEDDMAEMHAYYLTALNKAFDAAIEIEFEPIQAAVSCSM